MDALERYRLLNDLDDSDCVDCGAHEEQACEFDCLTRRLATETDLDENV